MPYVAFLEFFFVIQSLISIDPFIPSEPFYLLSNDDGHNPIFTIFYHVSLLHALHKTSTHFLQIKLLKLFNFEKDESDISIIFNRR